MLVTLNIWVVVYTCGLVLGLFMMLLFILFRKRYSAHVQNITLVFFILSFMLFGEITEESELVDIYPSLLGLSTTIDILVWPFLLFYVQYLVGERRNYKWSDLIFFTPFLIATGFLTPYLLLPAEAKLSYYSNGIPFDVALLVGFKVACSFSFLAHILYLLNSRIERFKKFFPKNKRVQFLSRIKHFTVGLSIILFFIYLFFFNNYFIWFPLGDSDRISSLIVAGMIYFLGILIFKNPRIIQEEQYSKQIIQSFQGKETQYIESLLKLVDQRKVYLNEKLLVTDVAKELGLNKQQLSYLINRQLGISFLDFINTFRVKEVQEKIKKGDHHLKTLLGLALESGFNSKASFNRIFKRHTEFSPSTYVKKIEQQASNRN